jgi:hypothetical protein
MDLITRFSHITKLKLKNSPTQTNGCSATPCTISFCATNSQLERQVLNKYWVLAPRDHHHRLLTFVRGSCLLMDLKIVVIYNSFGDERG